MTNLNTCALSFQFSPCCRGLSVCSETLSLSHIVAHKMLQNAVWNVLTLRKLRLPCMLWAVGVPQAQSQSHTPLTVFCSQSPKIFSCVSRELFCLLYSSIKCIVLFLTKMQHLFQIIILKMDKDTAFEVPLVFLVLIVADGGNQFAINLLSCQTLNIIKQSDI